MAVVKVNYIKGERAPGGARAAGDYYTHREGTDRGARVWYTLAGEKVDRWREIRSEVGQQARENKYTYRMVLSQEESRFGPEHYREILEAAGMENGYFVVHLHTEHQHAHAIAFTDRRLRPHDFATMRGRMSAIEKSVEKSMSIEGDKTITRDRGGEKGLGS